MRGTGQSPGINKKTRRNDVMKKINSIQRNNWDVKKLNNKCNYLKGSAKARVDCSLREARRTGGGPNEAGEVEDKDILILNSDKETSTSDGESITDVVEYTSFH